MLVSNQNLAAFNTFGISSVAEQYVYINRLEQLEELPLEEAPTLVLGGGSNLLLLDRLPGLVLHLGLKQVTCLATDVVPSGTLQYLVRVGAGENWHQFVLYALSQGWNGLENLIFIPGTVGAAPVQNIGAYGLEVAQRIEAVHAYEYGKGFVRLLASECQFGYRDSIFKQQPGRYLIVAVDFRLGGNYDPIVSYGAVGEQLAAMGYAARPTAGQLAAAILRIRSRKLPSWPELGNSGSFFKNPLLPLEQYTTLQSKYPDLPAYPDEDKQKVKIPAGWLIEKAGWKGRRSGAVGCYEQQALVIVNHGGASGQEVLAFSQAIQSAVLNQFGVLLEREVQVVGEGERQTHTGRAY